MKITESDWFYLCMNYHDSMGRALFDYSVHSIGGVKVTII